VHRTKMFSYIMLFLMVFSILIPIPVTHAASVDNILNTVAASTINNTGSTHNGLLGQLFDLLFNKILGPIFNSTSKSSTNNPVKPSPSTNGSGILKNKVIVVDPGHGGSNPGAVANNTREADNNLAVGLKLRDYLVQAGAKVIMTRDTDRTVASEGSSLGEELRARVNLAETNHADIFVSIHSNENSDSNIAGAMTFYPSGKSDALASEVERAIISGTGAIDKGSSSATFYVLRNTSMPSTLVEMGFVSNKDEAARLASDSYRNNMAQGIFNGIVNYFNNH